MAKITAPNRGYHGIAAGVVFTDGVGETNNAGAIAYFRRAGYEVEGKTDEVFPVARVTEAPENVYEPETPANVPFGAPLRDAAVAPLPKDFLPPTNAGLADPHGPLVVSPGLHGVTPGALVPGPVAVSDPAEQQAVETAVAEAVLMGNAPATEIPAIADAARGTGDGDGDRPAKNASKADWIAFAVSHGMDAQAAEDATKAELIEQHGG